ncbi:MAG: DUF1186 domain-containing protein [Planctomycetes bacterium]|nr:DUF1186 domain-containing protein [Planctomycetota bacterium]
MDEPQAITSEVGIETLIQQLDQSCGRLPEVALRSLQARREEAIPALIEAIRSATIQIRETGAYRGSVALFGIFLLTEFKAKEGLPAIVEGMSLPGEYPDVLFGDTITQVWPQTLAILASDQQELIDGLIDDRALGQFVRWGAVSSYVYLVQSGTLTRAEAVDRLRQHLRRAMDELDHDVLDPLVDELCKLRGVEAQQELDEAFDRDLVDLSIINRRSMRESLAATDAQWREEMQRRYGQGLEDTVAELKTWAGFRSEQDPDDPLTDWDEDADEQEAFEDEDNDEDWQANAWVDEPAPPPPVGTIRAEARPGRNDPCPCNSGKKFKKCCGAPGKV